MIQAYRTTVLFVTYVILFRRKLLGLNINIKFTHLLFYKNGDHAILHATIHILQR